MELPNLLNHHTLRLPSEPDAEMGVAMQILSSMAEADIPIVNYVWEPCRSPRDVLRKYIAPSMERLRRVLADRVAAQQLRESRYGGILLENEQRELLTLLVEASRNVPSAKRQKFALSRTMAGASLLHAGLPSGQVAVYDGDLEMLARESLLAVTATKGGTDVYDVTPKGYQYYSYLRETLAEPLETIGLSIVTHITHPAFAQRHPSANAKWLKAYRKLWGTDSTDQLTEIGHVCREAMQDFAESLATGRGVTVNQDRTKTFDRVRTVLAQCAHIGHKEQALLDALLLFWGTVIDLGQRQEHGSGKEGTPLVWEDARRLVFQTANAMHEVDRAVERQT